MPLSLLLFLIILAEGYVVLAAELLAIRQTTPFIGNGTDTVCVIIAAVLMPLACGYYAGGRFRPGMAAGRYMSIRRKLVRNIVISALFLLPALSYALIELFFGFLLMKGIDTRVTLVALYSLLFLVTPVFLLGQTVPLVSNYFSSEKLARITGKMLFCSTVGSFLGAVVSTLILMNFIGVHNTVNVVMGILTAIVIVISKRRRPAAAIIMGVIMAVSLLLNGDTYMRLNNVVSNNAYNMIWITEDEAGRHLMMNNNDSSLLGPNGEKHKYVDFLEDHYLDPLMAEGPPRHILVVGSAGFTFGLEDTKNTYVYVDIDKAVKPVAEEHFLKQKLTPNKRFVHEDIRSYLTRTDEKFDFIFLDAYLGGLTLPEYLVTQEFFMQVRGALADGGIVAGNFIISPNFAGRFSQRLDNTFRSVFPQLTRQVVDTRGPYDGWARDDADSTNVLYIAVHDSKADVTGIYTDNMNRVSFDKPRKNTAGDGR